MTPSPTVRLLAGFAIAVAAAFGQQGSSNIYLTPPSLLLADNSGSATVTVTTSPGTTQWSVSIPPAASWLSVSSGAAGIGNGVIQLQFNPNPTGTIRCTTVSVGSANLAACQSANSALTMVQLGATSVTFGENGGSGQVPIVSSSAPAETVPISTVQWISVPSLPPGAAGIEFQVQPNTAAASRVGQVGYGDATIQVSQAAYQSGLQNLIVGVVRDRQTGNPIPGAQAFFYGGGYGFATADPNGVYSFTGNDLHSFGGALSGNLYVGAPGYFEATPLSIPDLGSQPSLPVIQDVTLPPGGTMIRGVIDDASSGAAVAGATVSFNRNPMSTFLGGATTVSLTAAGDGTYVIDSSYFNESGLAGGFSANLQVTAANYLGASRNLTFTSYPQDENVAITAATGTVIRGTVTDRNTGQPIAGATVFFYGTGVGTVTTTSSGVYTFTANELRSFGGGLSGSLYVGATGYFEAVPVNVPDLGSQPSLPLVDNVTLKPGGTLVTGSVLNASTNAGIGGAAITFTRSPMSTFQGGATSVGIAAAANGTYTIDSSYFNESGLTTGFTVSLQAAAPQYLGANANLSFSTFPQTQNLLLTPETGAVLQGTVTDRTTGAPLSGAQEFFYGTGYGYATSNPNGLYLFTGTSLTSFGGALSGNLYVGDTGYFEAPPIAIPNLGSLASLPLIEDVTLLSGGPMIRGTITDSVTGAPIAGAVVAFTRSPMSTYQGGATTATVTSAADGTYVIDSSYFNESGLTTGFSVTLEVTAANYLGATQSVSFTSYPQIENFALTSYIVLTPPAAVLNAGQATSTFAVTLEGQYASSPWTAASESPWITVQSIELNPTGGTVAYLAPANGSGQPRTGAILVTVQLSSPTSNVRASSADRSGRLGRRSTSANNPSATFPIQQLASQTIAFSALANVALGAAPISISASASSNLPVSFASTTIAICTLSGTEATLLAPGTCSITASQAGNTAFAPANPVTESFLVTQPSLCYMSQTGSVTVGDAQRVINEALGILAPVHDLNLDGVVNLSDVQIMINATLGLGCSAI
jgi:hypothetical protein